MRLEHALEILKADVSFALRSCGIQLHKMDSLSNINEIASQSHMQLPLYFNFPSVSQTMLSVALGTFCNI